MNYCTRCGHQVSAGAAFCVSCGTPPGLADDPAETPFPADVPGGSGFPAVSPGAPGTGSPGWPGTAGEGGDVPGWAGGHVRLIKEAPATVTGEVPLQVRGEMPWQAGGEPPWAPGGTMAQPGGEASPAAVAGPADPASFTLEPGPGPETASSTLEPGPGPETAPFTLDPRPGPDAGLDHSPGEDTAAWLPGFVAQEPPSPLPLRPPPRRPRVEPPPPRRPLVLPVPADDDGYPAAPSEPSPSPTGPGPRRRGWLALLVVLALLVGGVAAWRYLSGSRAGGPAGQRISSRAAAGGQRAPSRPSPSQPSSSSRPGGRRGRSPGGSPGQSPGRSHPARGSAPVVIGAAAAGQPGTRAVAAFLTQYFAAINDHDYPAFSSLFEPGASPVHSAAEFRSGFRTSRDSTARLVSLEPTAAGDQAASVAFRSHQDPGNSATHTACTLWAVTFYLVPVGNSFLIASPPPGYQASARPCG